MSGIRVVERECVHGALATRDDSCSGRGPKEQERALGRCGDVAGSVRQCILVPKQPMGRPLLAGESEAEGPCDRARCWVVARVEGGGRATNQTKRRSGRPRRRLKRLHETRRAGYHPVHRSQMP